MSCPAVASEGGHHKAAPDHSESDAHHSAGEVLVMANTVTGIWHLIEEKKSELWETIDRGELSKVHEIAFAIRD